MDAIVRARTTRALHNQHVDPTIRNDRRCGGENVI
jgi:hypothetical protein